MRNAEEHKKLLEQIAALERDSVNYFDVEKEFFLIDSDNLSTIQTRFYGYAIQADGIYEEDNLTSEAVKNLDGRGCYVYVEVRDGQITIKQDLNGCWGIYLFRHGDYFALSNSFFRLLDHIKFRYSLTVNRDYCNYFLVNDLCSHAYSETAVNEVQLVERNAILNIDIANKNFQIEFIDYREHTIPLDSEEGIAILDRWVEFWGSVLRNVAQNTNSIQVDLSGGFDTRVSLALLLNSGIDLNKIRIYSSNDGLHVHPEDYGIASKIAAHYGFELNRPFSANRFLNFSLADIYNIDFYTRQTFHKSPHVFWLRKRVNKAYYIAGYSGETLRGYLRGSPKKYIDNQIGMTNIYSRDLSCELSNSIESILNSAFHAVQSKHKIENPDAESIPQYFYQETRVRSHYGKDGFLSVYFKNAVMFSPALDPEIRTLQPDTPECPNARLMIALLFTRYEPDLLKFPFEGGRSITPETIAYAQKINERFPRRTEKGKYSENVGGGYFYLQPRDTHAEKILASGRNNKSISRNLSEACLKAMFESSRTYGLFTSYFNEEIYRYAASYYDTHVFGRFRLMYGIVGVTKVLEDVEISQRNHQPYRDMQRFIEQDYCQIPVGNNAEQILRNLAPYITARMDIKLFSKTEGGDFQILSVSDDKAVVSKPEWFNKDGVGYVITSCVGKLKIVAKAATDGKITLTLRGRDVRNPEDKTKRVPYWIDYTKFVVNGQTIFNKLTPAWHDKSYRHNMNAKANEEITVEVEWLPHRSDT